MLRDEIADLIDKPLVVVATHIHYDHVGGPHEFDTRLVYASEPVRMTDYRESCAIATSQRPAPFLDSLSSAGMPVESDALIDALPHESFAIEGFRIRSALPTHELEEGHIVDLGSRSSRCSACPGIQSAASGCGRNKAARQ